MGLGIAALAFCCLFCACWYWAPATLAKIKMRKKPLYAATEAEIEKMIVGGKVAVAEDIDPDLILNPVQLHRFQAEEARARALKNKPKAKPALKRNESGSSGFIVAGAFAKLGINISFKAAKHRPVTTTREVEVVDLKTIDAKLQQQRAELEQAEAPTSCTHSIEDAIFRQAEEAASEARAHRRRKGWFRR